LKRNDTEYAMAVTSTQLVFN